MKKILLITVFASFLILFGCKKKRGCVDKDACNYDPTAEKYDGSCTYPPTWYQDIDGDGFGDPNVTLTQCEQPDGYVNSAATAADFIAEDCNGVSHHLFEELDAGKIVVLAWIMPCNTCITDPLNAYNLAQSYASTNPDRVVFYLADDYADSPCAAITGFGNFYGMTDCDKFASAAVNMDAYGAVGMPKIAVFGGAEHLVYYNQNQTTDGLKAAIDKAIADNPL
jgi:hypothetical protein